MRLSLRSHILLTLLPLLLLVGILGGAGAVLLYRLGGQVDAILRENYRSVLYMQALGEALERIDSSFQLALAGEEKQARDQYAANWKTFTDNVRAEEDNITLEEESRLVARLKELAEKYDRQATAFYTLPASGPDRRRAYFDPGGLFDLFKDIKTVAHRILHINQANMEKESETARATAVQSLLWFAIGFGVAAVLAGFFAWRTSQVIVQPIRAVTASAQGISTGNLDQVVPVFQVDELGQLAQAFNLMARHLRDYRQSQSDQLLRAQQTSQATIDSFPEPVLVIDPTGDVEMANPAARRLLGVVPRQNGQVGTGIWQPPETLREPLQEALSGQKDYLPESFDHTILLGASGRERALLPRILTIRDPNQNTLGAAVLLQDVTRLRLLDQVKSNLIATASHELKTPLTSIRLALHLLLEESVGPLSPKQTELLLDARDNSERLLAVINNLLDLARLEQGWRQLEVLSEAPRTLLEAAAERVRARAADKNVELVLEVPDEVPAVAVDADKIGHALGNLLDNALTYTDRGGRITLSAQRDGDNVVLIVADNGCGIPPEHLAHVFEKFFRVPGQSRGQGTGLGLAIVNEIVTAHGGRISCESHPGAGTTFRLRLPLAATTAPFVFGAVSPGGNDA